MTQLQRELGQALGDGVGVACTGIDGDPGQLWPDEREAVQKAIPRRQREFAAGRQAAREAMARIGAPAQAIPCGSDRAPVWPEGLVGSITHNAHLCIAVVGRYIDVHAVGIDIEEHHPLESALWPAICTREELATLENLPPSARGFWVTRVFCTKEAYYKWQYPQTGRMLDFCDVQVTFTPDSSEFTVLPSPLAHASERPMEARGRLHRIEGLVTAVVTGKPHWLAEHACHWTTRL